MRGVISLGPGRIPLGFGRAIDIPETVTRAPSWDFKVLPGKYIFEIVGWEAVYLSYFAIGTVAKDQIEPIATKSRVATMGNYDGGLHYKEVTARTEVIVRVEAWTQIPGRMNPNPLPPSCTPWVTIGPAFFGFPPWSRDSKKTLVQLNSFGTDWPSVFEKRENEEFIEFGLEDSGDMDFNDVTLRWSWQN